MPSNPASIGGSDIAALVGVAPERWAKPIDIWARCTGISPPPELSAAQLRIGQAMEPAIRALAKDELGLALGAPFNVERCLRPFHRASLDCGPVAGEIGELKAVSGHAASKWKDGMHPLNYEVQCQWYLAQSRASACHLVALISGERIEHHLVIPDTELQAMLIDSAERFWADYVETVRPPPPDSSAQYSDWLERRFPTPPAEEQPTIECCPDIDWLVSEYLAAYKEAKAAEAKKQRAANHIQALMGAASKAKGSGYSVSWGYSAGREKVDTARLFADVGITKEQLAAYTTRTPCRVFKVTEKK